MNKQLIGSIVLLTITLQIGCATTTQRKVQSLSEIRIDQKKEYEIDLIRNGKAYRIKTEGKAIEQQDDRLIVKQANGDVAIKSSEIQTITKEERSYFVRGLWIGAIPGLVLGAIVGLSFAGGVCDESLPNCDEIAVTAGLVGGPIVGGLIGGGIGSAIHKRSAITISPNISQKDPETRAGVGASLNF